MSKMSSYAVRSSTSSDPIPSAATNFSTKAYQYEPQVQLLCQRIKDEMLLVVSA